MAFPLKDVRFTTRRHGGGVTIYPRLLRDSSFLPRVDIAIQYFESMLGRERRDFDTEVLVHFFGDHKLARCLVAALARSYRFRSPEVAEVVTPEALERLNRAGAASPRALRFTLFDHVNDFGHGFLRGQDRQAVFGLLEGQLGLRPGELERLLTLDADEHAVLTRVGAEPRPADVVAQYNFGVLEALLRHAERIELELAGWPPETRAGIGRLCAAYDVQAHLDESGGRLRVTLFGRPDALGAWSRHGRRVARTLVLLLERARSSVAGGQASVALRERRVDLRLADETLDILGGPAATSTGWAEAPGWSVDGLAAPSVSRLVRRGLGIRRLPDPQAWGAGVVVPDLLVRRGDRRALVCVVRSPAHGARLAPIARAATTGEPLLFLGDGASLAPLRAVGAWTVGSASFDPDLLGEALREGRSGGGPAESARAS